MKKFLRNTDPKHSPFKNIAMSLVVFSVAVVISLTYTQTAYASLFSFVAELVGAGKVSADTQAIDPNPSPINSQNMPLLEAASNPNPNSNVCSDYLPVNGSILEPNIASADASSCASVNTQISTYTVNPGDTISGVAHMFNVSVNTILWANNLTGKSILQPGQTLVILPISGINYTVRSGDTLKGIAKKYGGDHVDETYADILSYNDISDVSQLKIGDTIIIPSAEISSGDVSRITSTANSKINPRSLSVDEPLLDNIKNWPSYPSCNSPAAGCYYLRPIVGGRISQKLHGHNAVDLAAPIGTHIVASADGTVIISRINGGWNGGYGNFVVISHSNGSQTLYAHMETRSVVKAGEHVKQGQLIGYIGMTGHTTGPHIHFEIRGAQNLFWNPNP
jgi:LysM repeat protein